NTLFIESFQSTSISSSSSLRSSRDDRKWSITPAPCSSNQSNRNQSSTLSVSRSSAGLDNSKNSLCCRLYSSLRGPAIANSTSSRLNRSARPKPSVVLCDRDVDVIVISWSGSLAKQSSKTEILFRYLKKRQQDEGMRIKTHRGSCDSPYYYSFNAMTGSALS